jgi:hypothetical protein
VQPGTFISRHAAAYHRYVSQWHPDKLETMAPELKDYATRQTVYEAERIPATPECSVVMPSRSFSGQDSVQDRGALPLKKASTNGRRDVYYTSLDEHSCTLTMIFGKPFTHARALREPLSPTLCGKRLESGILARWTGAGRPCRPSWVYARIASKGLILLNPCAACGAVAGLRGSENGDGFGGFRCPHLGLPRQGSEDSVQVDGIEPIRDLRPVLAGDGRRTLGRRATARI